MLILRLLRLTLFPKWPTGPRNARRLGLLLLLIPAFLALQMIHWVGFLLDEIFFRGFRSVKIREPLFIVGLPRSGTTFLHRVLARDSDRFTTTRMWELLVAPSVAERKFWLALGALNRALGEPFSRMGQWGERAGLGWLEAIHDVSLTDPEEDYFLLLPVFACFLLVVPFPYLEAIWELSRFDDLPGEKRRRIMAFYRSALQRHLFVAGPGKQILSKNPSFTSFLFSLRETFPDGKFLCCVRDPLEVVPSQLSSIRAGTRLFGYDVSEPAVRDRFLAMLDFYAKHALSALQQIPENQHAFLPLTEMRKDVKGSVLRVYARFGWTPDPEFEKELAAEARRGKSFESRHSYSLEEFGLSPGQVRDRFPELNARFGFAREGKSP